MISVKIGRAARLIDMSIDLPLDDPPARRVLAPALAPHAVRLDALARLPLSDEVEADVGLHEAGRIRPVDGGDLELGDARRAAPGRAAARARRRARRVGRAATSAARRARTRRARRPRSRSGGTAARRGRRAPGARSRRQRTGPSRAGLAERPQLRFDRRGDRLGGERVVAGLELRRERLEELGRLQRRSIDGAGRRLGRRRRPRATASPATAERAGCAAPSSARRSPSARACAGGPPAILPRPAGAAGHPHLDRHRPCRVAEPEQRPQIGLRQVAAAGAHLARLRPAAARDRHGRADREAVARRRAQAERDPVLARSAGGSRAAPAARPCC